MQDEHDPKPEDSIGSKDFEKLEQGWQERAYLNSGNAYQPEVEQVRATGRTDDEKSTLSASPSVVF